MTRPAQHAIIKLKNTPTHYNADGIRTSKTVNGVVHEYYLNGSQIVAETWVTNGVEYLIHYLYDESGAPIGMKYRHSALAAGVYYSFFFEKNLQGDIIAIYNEDGIKIGTYTYDAWGAVTAVVTSGVTSMESSVVRNLNPFRYRSYYYDTETGYYYLQSRYYNPGWGRFINVDAYLNANQDILGYNIIAYCSNNPIMFIDKNGESWNSFWKSVGDFLWNVVSAVGESIEADAGMGYGLGLEINDVGVENYRDFSVGVDDGATKTGTVVSTAISGIDHSHMHVSEINGEIVPCSNHDRYDITAQTVCNCSNSETSNTITAGIISYNVGNGDVSLTFSASFHALVGGHVSFNFNLSEFKRRLFD